MSAQWWKTFLLAEVDVKMAAIKIVVTSEGLFLSGLMSQWGQERFICDLNLKWAMVENQVDAKMAEKN